MWAGIEQMSRFCYIGGKLDKLLKKRIKVSTGLADTIGRSGNNHTEQG
jgi:hypothetical protein